MIEHSVLLLNFVNCRGATSFTCYFNIMFHLCATGTHDVPAPEPIDWCHYIIQEVLQPDIKLNAHHCDKGFSNQLFLQKPTNPQEHGDVIHEDDTIASVKYYNNAGAWMQQHIFTCVMRHSEKQNNVVRLDVEIAFTFLSHQNY